MSESISDVLWSAFDSPSPLFDPSEFDHWPKPMRDRLLQDRWVVPAPSSRYVACPSCDGAYTCRVRHEVLNDDTTRRFICCPGCRSVDIEAEILRRWTLGFDQIAARLAESLSLKGAVKACAAGRLWRLGRTPWAGGSREVWLTRALSGGDAESVVRLIGAQGRAIVLVAEHLPPPTIWPGRLPAVVPLFRVTDLDENGVVVDVTLMHRMVTDADTDAEAHAALPLDPAKKKLIVRRQLKAELKSHLADDAVLAAYRLNPSLRKAAEDLSKATGINFNKDAVKRVIDRHGGIAAVMRDGESGSLGHVVASHRRDRAKKFTERR